MQGQIPCSACWHCSPGSGGTGPMTTFEDPAERQSPSASAGGWQPHGFSSLQSQWQGTAPCSVKEGVNQTWGSSSLRFLVLFVHQHKFLGVYSCCEHWIVLSVLCVACRGLLIAYQIISPHLPTWSKGEIKLYNTFFCDPF